MQGRKLLEYMFTPTGLFKTTTTTTPLEPRIKAYGYTTPMLQTSRCLSLMTASSDGYASPRWPCTALSRVEWPTTTNTAHYNYVRGLSLDLQP
eukprot:5021592-Karenia_brevis.AAC.1